MMKPIINKADTGLALPMYYSLSYSTSSYNKILDKVWKIFKI